MQKNLKTRSEIQRGDLYFYKDNFYYVMNGSIKIKCPETKEWVEGVLYYRFVDGETMHFARSKKDFEKKFEFYSHDYQRSLDKNSSYGRMGDL